MTVSGWVTSSSSPTRLQMTMASCPAFMSNLVNMNLLTYISCLSGKDIKNKEISTKGNLRELEATLFNQDSDFKSLPKPNAILEFETKDLFNETYQTVYLYDTYRDLHMAGKLTQIELSERAGVGLRFIRELENGKSTVRLDKVTQVLQFFGYHIDIIKN